MNGIAVYRKLCAIRDRLFSLSVARSFAACGAGTVFQLPVRIEGEQRIHLGVGVTVGPGCWLVAHPDRGTLAIGDRTAISGHCVFAAAELVTIGSSVLIAQGVMIADHSHDRSLVGVPVRDSGVSQIAPIVIGDGSWLGQNAVILPGVTVGAGAVIGANSVVRDDIPERAVAVGAPARIVGHRDK